MERKIVSIRFDPVAVASQGKPVAELISTVDITDHISQSLDCKPALLWADRCVVPLLEFKMLPPLRPSGSQPTHFVAAIKRLK